MSASGWQHWTRYQRDIQQALEVVRKTVMDAGATGAAADTKESPFTEDVAKMHDFTGPDFDAFLNGTTVDAQDPLFRLLNAEGADATGTILDVTRIKPEPVNQESDFDMNDMGVIRPASVALIQRLTGSTQPSRVQIEDVANQFATTCIRNTGIYVIAYLDGTPAEILFAGVSGD